MSLDDIKIIQKRIENNFLKKLQERDSTIVVLSPSSIFKIFAGVFAPIFWGLERLINYRFNKLFIKNVETVEEINQMLGLHLNSSIKSGSKANGKARFTVTATSGYTVSAGLELYTDTDLFFIVKTETMLKTPSDELFIQAVSEGTSYNIADGTNLYTKSPISEVSEIKSVGITGGTESESVSEAKTRLIQHFTKIKTGGTVDDYTDWALSVNGVKEAFILENTPNLGGVTVLITNNNYADYIPNATLINEVTDAINDNKVLGTEVLVQAPLEVKINITLQISGENLTNDKIKEAIQKYLFNNAKPKTTIEPSQISQVISEIEGEISHVLTSPTASITTNERQVVTLGELIVTIT